MFCVVRLLRNNFICLKTLFVIVVTLLELVIFELFHSVSTFTLHIDILRDILIVLFNLTWSNPRQRLKWYLNFELTLSNNNLFLVIRLLLIWLSSCKFLLVFLKLCNVAFFKLNRFFNRYFD
jgi:hypothetical protein